MITARILRHFHRWGWMLVVAACYFAFTNAGLNEPDEGRYAEIAREMALPGGDWLTPHLNGIPHFQKPPLLYWCTAVSLKVFGAQPWAARLPVVFAALSTLALAAWLARTLFGHGLHRTTVLVLSSSLGFYWLARLLTPDMMLTFWITAAIACAVRRYFGGSERWGMAFFVVMGLGFLTKGPMALVVPICATLGMRWGMPAVERPRMPWVLGMLVTLAIGLSWFIGESIRHQKLFEYFAGYELVQRFASGHHGRSKPFWFFILVLPVAFLPWSAWVVSLARDLWRRTRRRTPIGPRAGLLLGWVVPPFLILSFSGSKLPTYILPLLPALTLGVVAWSRLHGQRASAIHRTAFGMLGLLLLSGSVRDFADPLLAQQSDTADLAEIARSQPDFDQATLFASNVRAHGFTFMIGRLVSVTDDEADVVLKPTPEQKQRLFNNAAELERAMAELPIAYGIVRRRDFGKTFPRKRWKEMGTEGDFTLLGRLPEPAENAEDLPVP